MDISFFAAVDYLKTTGFFSFLLPVIFISALLFVILSKTKLFDNLKISIAVSLLIALIASQFEFVRCTFSDVFPRFAIALAVVLAFWILLGLFIDVKSQMFKYTLGFLAIAVFIVIFSTTTCPFRISFGDYFWKTPGAWLGWIGMIVLLIILVNSYSEHKSEKPENKLDKPEKKESKESADL